LILLSFCAKVAFQNTKRYEENYQNSTPGPEVGCDNQRSQEKKPSKEKSAYRDLVGRCFGWRGKLLVV
jgi:hypothetical protein